MSQVSQAGRPGRYQRSTGGLVGAILVLFLVVVGVVLFRGAFRQTPTYEPEHLDYLALVTSVQRTGAEPVYPQALPDGWFVKDVEFAPGDRPVFDLAMTTADGTFAGLHQEDESVDDLVSTYVDADATAGEVVEIPGSVARSWQTFSDAGGDHAFAAEVGEQTVLVYGSADQDDLRALVESLTTAELQP